MAKPKEPKMVKTPDAPVEKVKLRRAVDPDSAKADYLRAGRPTNLATKDSFRTERHARGPKRDKPVRLGQLNPSERAWSGSH